jgi:hypothetical protein
MCSCPKLRDAKNNATGRAVAGALPVALFGESSHRYFTTTMIRSVMLLVLSTVTVPDNSAGL